MGERKEKQAELNLGDTEGERKEGSKDSGENGGEVPSKMGGKMREKDKGLNERPTCRRKMDEVRWTKGESKWGNDRLRRATEEKILRGKTRSRGGRAKMKGKEGECQEKGGKREAERIFSKRTKTEAPRISCGYQEDEKMEEEGESLRSGRDARAERNNSARED